MDAYVNKVKNVLIDLPSYHSRFSSIQKIVIISLIVGLLSIFYIRLLTVVGLFLLTLICTICVCLWLLSVQTHFRFLENVLPLYTYLKYKGITQEQKENNQTAAANITVNKHNKDVSNYSINEQGEHQIRSTPTSDTKTKYVPDHWKIEAVTLTDYVVRDFIQPWYDTFPGAKPDVLDTSYNILHKCLMLFCHRLGQADKHKLIHETITLYCKHLETFQNARMLYNTQPKRRKSLKSTVYASRRNSLKIHSVEDAYEKNYTYHKAVWDEENEITYIRSLVHILLSQLLSDHLQTCVTSQQLLVEILSCNVLLPVLDLLATPDFLHESIISILSDDDTEGVKFDLGEDDFEKTHTCPILDDDKPCDSVENVEQLEPQLEDSLESENDWKDTIDDDTPKVQNENNVVTKSDSFEHINTVGRISHIETSSLQNVTLTTVNSSIQPTDQIPKSKSSHQLKTDTDTEQLIVRQRSYSDARKESSDKSDSTAAEKIVLESNNFTNKIGNIFSHVASSLKYVNNKSSKNEHTSRHIHTDSQSKIEIFIDSTESGERSSESSNDTVILDTQAVIGHPKSSNDGDKLSMETDNDSIMEEIPNLFVDISIEETETAQELRSTTTYTLYVVKVFKMFLLLL